MLKLKESTYKNLLIVYWIAIPFCFYLYLFMTSSMRHVSVTHLIQNIPGLTLGFLLCSLMLIQSATVYFIHHFSTSRNGLIGKFLYFSTIQQLLTGNLIGAILCFFYNRSLVSTQETTSKRNKIMMFTVCVIIALLSLLTLFVTWQLNKF